MWQQVSEDSSRLAAHPSCRRRIEPTTANRRRQRQTHWPGREGEPEPTTKPTRRRMRWWLYPPLTRTRLDLLNTRCSSHTLRLELLHREVGPALTRHMPRPRSGGIFRRPVTLPRGYRCRHRAQRGPRGAVRIVFVVSVYAERRRSVNRTSCSMLDRVRFVEYTPSYMRIQHGMQPPSLAKQFLRRTLAARSIRSGPRPGPGAVIRRVTTCGNRRHHQAADRPPPRAATSC